MSSHLALPREGHLEALFHIFAYLQTGLDFLRHDRGGYEGGATSIHARFKR